MRNSRKTYAPKLTGSEKSRAVRRLFIRMPGPGKGVNRDSVCVNSVYTVLSGLKQYLSVHTPGCKTRKRRIRGLG